MTVKTSVKIGDDLLKGDYKRNEIFFFAMNANWKF